MPIVIILIVAVVGSLLFHFLSPWGVTPLASNWGAMDFTLQITLAITGIVFTCVLLFTAYAVYKYRHKEGSRAEYEPENAKLEGWLTLITSAGVIAMLAPGLSVWADFVQVPEGAKEFEAVGQQWSWKYRFPGADGVLGKTEAGLISYDNPYGINPEDPAGLDDVLVEDYELHLPLGGPIKANLRTHDVLHNFYVSQFRAKMDLVPGMVTYYWFEPTKTGTYDIICAEYCGTGHYSMSGKVVVDEPADFEAWLAGYPTFGSTIEVADAGGAAATEDEAE